MTWNTEIRTLTIPTHQWIQNPFLGNCIQFVMDQDCINILFRWNEHVWTYTKLDHRIVFDTSDQLFGTKTALLDDSIEIFVEAEKIDAITGDLFTQSWTNFDME